MSLNSRLSVKGAQVAMPRDMGPVTDDQLGSAGVGMSDGHTIGEAPIIRSSRSSGDRYRALEFENSKRSTGRFILFPCPVGQSP